jgi:hypothetical protein
VSDASGGRSAPAKNGLCSESAVEAIAADAIERLDALGFVGILELGESAWRGLERQFGVTLDQQRTNITGQLGSAATPQDQRDLLAGGVLALLEKRTAADALAYDHALDRAGITTREDRQRIAREALAAQLVRLGDLCGASAGRALDQETIATEPRDRVGRVEADLVTLNERVDRRERAVSELSEQLHRKDEELARVRGRLEGVEASASWRLTAPLRSVKCRLRGQRR